VAEKEQTFHRGESGKDDLAAREAKKKKWSTRIFRRRKGRFVSERAGAREPDLMGRAAKEKEWTARNWKAL